MPAMVNFPPLQNQPPLPWQWFNWWTFPSPRRTFSTATIWKPGNVPYRLMAWQPDIIAPTIARFTYDLNNWSAVRGVRPSSVVLNLNTGSVGIRPVS